MIKLNLFGFIVCVAVITLMNSCATLSPNKQVNGGCGTENYKHRFKAKRQWVKERSDGYYVVISERMNCRHDHVFECKPSDSILAKL